MNLTRLSASDSMAVFSHLIWMEFILWLIHSTREYYGNDVTQFIRLDHDAAPQALLSHSWKLLSVVLCEIPNQPVQRDHRETPRKERQQRSHGKLNCWSWGWILEHRAIPLCQHWVSPRLHVFPPEAMEMKPWRQTILTASDLNFYLGKKNLCEEKNNMYASHHKKSVSIIMTIRDSPVTQDETA